MRKRVSDRDFVSYTSLECAFTGCFVLVEEEGRRRRKRRRRRRRRRRSSNLLLFLFA
jgi:hypothetical protein